jgi:hypothetical protein
MSTAIAKPSPEVGAEPGGGSPQLVLTETWGHYLTLCSEMQGGRVSAIPVYARRQVSRDRVQALAAVVGAGCVSGAEFSSTATAAPIHEPIATSTATVLASSSAVEAPASLLAGFKGADLRVAPSIEHLLRDLPENSVTVVARPGELNQSTLLAIARAGAKPHIRLGVLTARSFEALTIVIAKTILHRYASKGRCLTVLDQPQLRFATGPHRVADWSDLEAQQFGQLVEDDLGVLSLATHGDNIDANLGSGVLCGRGKAAAAERSEDPSDPCLASADFCRRDPDGSRTRVSIDELRCGILYSEACSGANVSDGIFPSDLALALGALDGWISAYVASAKVARSTEIGGLAFTALMRSGATLGEAAHHCQAMQVSMTGDVPGYVVFGDPDLRLAGAGDEFVRHVVDWPADAELPATARLECPAPATVIEYVGAGADLGGARFAARIQSDAPASAVLAFTMPLPESCGVSVLVFSAAESLCSIRIDLERADSEPAKELASDLGRNIEFLRYLHEKAATREGLRDTPELQRLASDLELALEKARKLRVEAAVAAAASPVLTVAGQDAPIKTMIDRLDAALEGDDRSLAERWRHWKMPHHLAPFYEPWLTPSGRERPAGPCYLCGTHTFEIDSVAPMRPDLIRRVTHCARCGVLSDRAANEPMIRILAPEHVRAGEPTDLALDEDGSKHFCLSMAISLGLESGSPWLRYSISRKSDRFVLEIDKATPSGTYHLIGLRVRRLGLNLTTRPIHIEACR